MCQPLSAIASAVAQVKEKEHRAINPEGFEIKYL